MKVAFCIRNDYLDRFGGDSVQFLKTKEFLEKKHGLDIVIVTDPAKLRNETFDICHIFNLHTEAVTRDFLEACRGKSMKIALSTIFWDTGYALANYLLTTCLGIYRISERKVGLVRKIFGHSAAITGWPRFGSKDYQVRYLEAALRKADMILPNSREELAILSNMSGIDIDTLDKKAKVVRNAVEFWEDVADSPGKRFFTTLGIERGYVLQVGRIEPLKNQIGLLMALRDDPEIPIVFIGGAGSCHRYSAKLARMAKARGNVRIVDPVPREYLTHFYTNARLHVLPSLQENTGLVSLEALWHGCRAVVAIEGFCPYNSYFNGIATGVNPLNIREIREGIDREIASYRDMTAIRRRIREDFSWEGAARDTYDGYKMLI